MKQLPDDMLVRRVLADARDELNSNRAHFGFPAL